MIVIKPIEVNDSTLTSSSIPEPDASKGEVEWASRDSNTATDDNLRYFDLGGGFLWALDSTTNNIHKYTERFVFIESFDISAQVTVPKGIAYASGVLWVLNGADSRIYSFGVDGAFLFFSFSVAVEVVSPDCVAWDGNFINVFDANLAAGNVATYSLGGLFNGSWVVPSVAATISVFGAASDGVNMYVNSGVEKKLLIVPLSDYSLQSSFVAATPFGGSLAGCAVRSGRVFMSDNSIVYEYSSLGQKSSGYIAGEEAVKSSSHSSYVSTIFSNDDPEIGVLKTPPTWTYKQPTNKYAMFDEVVNTQSLNDLTQVIEITPGVIVGGIAGINITGATAINVTMTDPIDGIVYDRDVNMIDNTNIVNWFNYLWDPFVTKEDFVFLDLPPFADATTKITITGAAEIGVGAIVLGPTIAIGETDYDGTTVQNLDFDIWQEDSFGNLEIIPRPGAKLVNYGVKFLESNLNYVASQLNSLRGVAAVYVGADGDEFDYTLVYGIKRESEIDIQPQICTVPVQVRGLT